MDAWQEASLCAYHVGCGGIAGGRAVPGNYVAKRRNFLYTGSKCRRGAVRRAARNEASVSLRLRAILEALFVAFLWSTSWVFIKVGIQDIPPLTFAGLRYCLGFGFLLLVLLRSPAKVEVQRLPGWVWGRLIILGLLFYAGTQGTQFYALARLPAITVNLLWGFSSITVALLSSVWLSEKPTHLQWGGIILAILGAWLYFVPVAIPKAQVIGLSVALAGIIVHAISLVLGREINRSTKYSPLMVTVISMGAGSGVLLLTGLAVEGVPAIDFKGWAIIFWLAGINTAFAFTLMNHTLRTLTAMESSMINSTMLIWIP
ncbi:MAG: DMT family transporter, partial [Anaerolineales bacterium]|nr:DMT family transporter [Anaerolineales bacterium]